MSRVRPKNNTPDCVLLDHAPEDFVTIPSCDWTIRPHLTLRIIEFLRANPDASAWAYHLGTNLRRPVVTGATANLSKFVFEEDIEFKKYFREDREVFEQRVRKYLERLNEKYRKNVEAIGPLAELDASDGSLATTQQARKLTLIRLRHPWWDNLHALWYRYYTGNDSESKETDAQTDSKTDRKITKKRKLDSDLDDFIVSDAEFESESDSESSIDSKRRRMTLRSASVSTSKLGKFSPTPPAVGLKTPPRTPRKCPASSASSSTLLASPQIVTPSPTVVSDDSSRSAAIFKDIKEILKMNIRILELEAEKRV